MRIRTSPRILCHSSYGKVFTLRAGATRHQPLRFPGQEAGTGETSYNIFRWYQSSFGRYTQPNPLGLNGDVNLYKYAKEDPIINSDRTGLLYASGKCADCPSGNWISTAVEGEASVSAGIGAVGGLVFVGAMVCTSNPYFSVPFITVCGVGGAGAGGGHWPSRFHFEKKLGKGFGVGGGIEIP